MSSALEPVMLDSSDSLDEWDRFVDRSPQGSIFCRPWWLRSVCPGSFTILTLCRAGEIVAGMPLPETRKRGRAHFVMPPLTQVLGALVARSQRMSYERRLSDEMEILEKLVDAIPDFASYQMRFHYMFRNWLPFYWAGYRQTTRYTYVIPNLERLEDVFRTMAHSKRKNISRARRMVTVHTDLEPLVFYENHRMTLKRQGDSIAYDLPLFLRIHEAACEHRAGRIWYALDKRGNLHAAIFVVYDKKSAYYLISTIDPEYRDSGAASLLLFEAMSHLSDLTRRFDFEGSMIRGVENSFRKFGAIQMPYFSIVKDIRSPLLQVGTQLLRKAKGALRQPRRC